MKTTKGIRGGKPCTITTTISSNIPGFGLLDVDDIAVMLRAARRDKKRVKIATKALRFYAEQKHFDTVEGFQPGPMRLTRILDNGDIAESALTSIKEMK